MARVIRYRLIDWARGTSTVDQLNALRQWQFEESAYLAKLQRQSMEEYLDELKKVVPFWRSVSRIEDIPVTDKEFLTRHRAELLNPRYANQIIRKKTGGSTGKPFVYYTSREAQGYLWAGLLLSWEAAGYELGDQVAFLAGSSLYGSGWKNKIYYKLLNVKLLSAFDMSEEALDRYAAALKGGIRLLYGYASAIHRLAQRVLAQPGSRRRFSLRAVVCTSEVLTATMRLDIENAFGVPCYSQYGCNEAGISAFECEHRSGFHLISTRCYAEIVDQARLIATDLANKAMFMPRYETGDLVAMATGECPCGRGFPLIQNVYGRQNDLVEDATGHVVHSEFFAHLFREDARIHAFQVLFDRRVLVVNAHVDEKDLESFRRSVGHYREKIEQSLSFQAIRFEENRPFVLLKNAKRRHVMRVERV